MDSGSLHLVRATLLYTHYRCFSRRTRIWHSQDSIIVIIVVVVVVIVIFVLIGILAGFLVVFPALDAPHRLGRKPGVGIGVENSIALVQILVCVFKSIAAFLDEEAVLVDDLAVGDLFQEPVPVTECGVSRGNRSVAVEVSMSVSKGLTCIRVERDGQLWRSRRLTCRPGRHMSMYRGRPCPGHAHQRIGSRCKRFSWEWTYQESSQTTVVGLSSS